MPHKVHMQTQSHKDKIAKSQIERWNKLRSHIRFKKQKHDVFSARQIINQSSKWRYMKKKAKAMHPKCENCGSSLALEVHHIESLEDLIIDFLISCGGICSEVELLDYDKFFDLDNISVLCRRCHQKPGLHRNR